MTYYNTNNETGDTLKQSEKQTETQQTNIKRLMKGATHLHTASEIHAEYERLTETKVPRTSIGRSLTNLKKEGILEKTDVKKEGDWGKMQHTWRYIR